VIAAVLVAATLPAARLVGDPDNAAPWYALATANRVATLFVLVWLAAAIQRLRAARLTLAEEAVTRGRLRIDVELRPTLGAALESIVVGGRRAAEQVGGDSATLETELRALIETSRVSLDAPAETLADGVRRVFAGEQVIDPELIAAALETGASPLTAREADVLRAWPRAASRPTRSPRSYRCRAPLSATTCPTRSARSVRAAASMPSGSAGTPAGSDFEREKF
jgi:hypothetical protein